MRISTYNILADEFTDINLREGVKPHHLTRSHRTPLIIKSIEESYPDIIALQELDAEMFSALQDHFEDRYKGCMEFHRLGKASYGNGFLYRKFLNPSFAKYYFPSGMFRVVPILLFTECSIANVHLDFTTSDDDMSKFLDVLQVNSIVCGDFNSDKGSSVLKVCDQYGFSWKPFDWTMTYSFNTIDYIMTRGNVVVKEQNQSFVDKVIIPNERQGSDHVLCSAKIGFV